MRKYKENEDNREKFFEERTKGGAAAGASTKQVFGGGAGASPSEALGGMFSGQGDLALQRKLEKASITVERVEENAVVEPKTE
jgi:hypothetical protein